MNYAGRSEMNFVVAVRSARSSKTVSAKTVDEAISEAERLAELGVVTITDPHNVEFSQEKFDELRRLWQRRY